MTAYVALYSGKRPRIFVTFPADNSGIGVWFSQLHTMVRWVLIGEPKLAIRHDGKGRPLYGVVAAAAIDAPFV
ncbi:MAG: hypothetical protein KGJ79_04565 [Alphaproteobacteria bacterium]|nr:hypothetical protein [Alphaproteobacteria bacterium]MDE2110394.1 hypothetical protein [Alphaproteobacteria bacterium]MDE2495269.1 hypothetical protein [Alphaproteobacteria bacterium]